MLAGALLLFFFLRDRPRKAPETVAPPPAPPSPTKEPSPKPPAKPPVAAVEPPKPEPAPAPAPVPETPILPGLAVSSVASPAGQLLHKELIPKNIEIAKFYYERKIAAPGTSIGFDIDGSGFTDEFEKTIVVEAGSGVSVSNMRLVTANQIHGDMTFTPNHPTQFVFPSILINKLPVFVAHEPVAVVRKGEVLGIVGMSLDAANRSERFQVITNLDEAMARQFWIEATTPGIEISGLTPHLPFTMEGSLRASRPNVARGDFGLIAYIGPKEVWRKDKILRLAKADIGPSGYIREIAAAGAYRRPGETVEIAIKGDGFEKEDAAPLRARVDETDMGEAAVEFVSPAELRFSFKIPADAPLQSYGVTVLGANSQKLQQKRNVFNLVPENWIRRLRPAAPLKAGQAGQIELRGRALSSEFVDSLTLTSDEPGIRIQKPKLVDESKAVAEVDISSSVAPGDYWIRVSAGGKLIDPARDSIIKVQP